MSAREAQGVLQGRTRRPCSPRLGLVYIARMRRSWPQRLFAGVIWLWFAVALPGVASMPMAEGGGATMAGMPGMAPMGHDGSAQCQAVAGHPSPVAPDGSAPTRHRQHSGCDGTCCTPATVTLAAGRLVAIPVVPARVVTSVATPARDAARPAAPQVVLPPPVGPPVLWA